MTIYLAAFPVNPTQFVGLGTSSNNPLRNTVVIPQNATITGMILNIRDEPLATGETVSAQILRSTNCGNTFAVTGIIATVTGPNNPTTPNCCAFVVADFDVNQCDLLTVQITRSDTGESLENGVAVTIMFTLP
jgi:hypothetical protein